MSPKVESYRDLIVWQKSHHLVLELYKAKLSKKESESLAAKMRESAFSIPSFIAVGFKKRGKKAKLYFYRSALTALQQLEYYLLLANELGFLKNYSKLSEEIDTIERMLKSLIHSNLPS